MSLILLVEVIETLLTLKGESRYSQHQRRMDMIPHRHRSPQNNLWKTASLATLARRAEITRAIRIARASAKHERGTLSTGLWKTRGHGGIVHPYYHVNTLQKFMLKSYGLHSLTQDKSLLPSYTVTYSLSLQVKKIHSISMVKC